jgi:hypothetical protein
MASAETHQSQTPGILQDVSVRLQFFTDGASKAGKL